MTVTRRVAMDPEPNQSPARCRRYIRRGRGAAAGASIAAQPRRQRRGTECSHGVSPWMLVLIAQVGFWRCMGSDRLADVVPRRAVAVMIEPIPG